MNAKVLMVRRCRVLLALVLEAFFLGEWPGPAAARPQGLSSLERLRRADELYRADQLLQAEMLYRQALHTADGIDRRRCFDRLLAIYVRIGRHDQAIRTALEYERWLHLAGDWVRKRDLNLDLGRWHLALGHYPAAESYLRRALAELPDTPLPPARQITALTYLALAVQKQGGPAARDPQRAARAWQQVETFARARLDSPGKVLDLPLRIECVRRLADSYRFQERPEDAIAQLEQILPAFEKLKKPDPTGRRDTLRQLAGQLASARRHADAEQRLKEALELHRQHGAGDRLTGADLLRELAEVVERQGRLKEGQALWPQAIREYRAVLEDPRAGQPEVAGALAAFWKLQLLHQRLRQYNLALTLTREQAEQWTGSLIEPRLHGEQGRLQVFLGDYSPSRRLLANAVRDLESQSPPNLVELPAALLVLAVAELGTDLQAQAEELATRGRARAEELGRRCLDLYRTHQLADDLVLVETYNLLGTCAAQDGDYVQAIDHYRAGVTRCAGLGPVADPSHCNLLLNIALLHKSQGDLDRALAACQEARKVYQRFAAPDALGFAAFDAAEAAQLAARARLVEANALTEGILRRCRQHNIPGGPLVITARHCQALFHLHRREFAAAEQGWREVAKLHGPESPLRPRTLNYLALTRECQGRLEEAAELYQEARRFQEQNPRAFPVTHFTTLWRLANIADARGRQTEARALLEEAIQVVEKARLRTYGDAQQRAAFFAQFAPAFDQLVTWSARAGDVPAAVAAVARGRSRTLLDQLLLANIDPLQGLRGAQGEAWRRQEAALRQRIAALRASAVLIAPEALGTGSGRRLLTELDAAQQQYTEVYREVLNASPVYRSLARQEFTAADLKQLRDRVLGPKKLLLVYHIGRHQSHLLLLGGSDSQVPSHAPAVFALTVPADVAERVAPPPPLSLAQALGKSRGIALKREQPDLPLLQTRFTGAPQRDARPGNVPLGQAVLRALVENYLEQIADPTFRPTRGVRLRPRDTARPLPVQRPELLAEILLPPDARERIRAQAPDCLILVCDGALHKLPFEALLLRAGDRPAYVLDELPPLVYAPSVAILALLADRPSAAPAGLRSLLTVADPVYPQPIRRLPHSAEESLRISRFFDPQQVVSLRGVRAAEKALRESLPGRHVVHIAAHGIADERFGNQFGGLLLTLPPPGQETPEDDGFLALHEIYTLPLERCELAVLSACLTNVGPQQPLEAGVTLAGGFLAAGARRVVASHWDTDDESTGELMAAFLREVMAAKAGQPVAYAQALQQARRGIRARAGADWSAPYFWAPFVLVGLPD